MSIKRFKNNLKLFITAIAVVFIWRGVWGLLDHYIIPINADLAYFGLIVAGILILMFDDLELQELSEKDKRK